MIRGLKIVLLVLTLMLIISGCWDKREVEDLGIVNGIAIEADGANRIKIIVQTVNAAALAKSGGGGSGATFQKAYRNLVIKGDNTYDAIKNLELSTSNQRFFAHTDVIVVSEEFARTRGLRDILDYLSRDPQWRSDVWLLVGRGDMTELFDLPGVIQPVPAQRIIDILKLQKSVSAYAPNRMGEFINLMTSETSQPYTAMVDTIPNLSRPAKGNHTILNGQVPEPEKSLSINKTAVFRKDKMVGWLDQKQGQGLLFIRGEIEAGQIKFRSPDGSGKMISTEILQSTTRLKPQIINGNLVMEINVEVSSALEDVEANIPVIPASNTAKLNEAQKKVVTDSIQSALDKALREYQVDVFDFGEAFHRQYPKQWDALKKQWPELLPAIQTKIVVKSTIRHTNLLSDPPNIKASGGE